MARYRLLCLVAVISVLLGSGYGQYRQIGLCSPRPVFPQIYVLPGLCSPRSLFPRSMLPQVYVPPRFAFPKGLFFIQACVPPGLFPQIYVLPGLCSPRSLFPRSVLPQIAKLGGMVNNVMNHATTGVELMTKGKGRATRTQDDVRLTVRRDTGATSVTRRATEDVWTARATGTMDSVSVHQAGGSLVMRVTIITTVTTVTENVAIVLMVPRVTRKLATVLHVNPAITRLCARTGQYGQKCSESCGNCHDTTTCDHVNGHCPDRCRGNFTMPLCQGRVSQHYQNVDVMSSPHGASAETSNYEVVRTPEENYETLRPRTEQETAEGIYTQLTPTVKSDRSETNVKCAIM
ncbi:hypothetical protein BaRGS_00026837 [Batillaria attramentaria]|uniref:Uncharacterized protein n=1 Tax=Batillaria attramentaria TaxID=370345 RepID=A0ABD0K3W1_9CAEN